MTYLLSGSNGQSSPFALTIDDCCVGGVARFQKGHRMKLYPDDWRVRVTTALVLAVCMAVVMFLGPTVGINGFVPYMLSIVVGILLGQFVGRVLFQSAPGRPPE